MRNSGLTKEQERTLRRLWGKKSCSEIGKAIGIKSRSTVYTIARRMGLPQIGRKSVWNQSMVETLQRLVKEGYSATQIQRYLGGEPSLSAISCKIRELRIREGRGGLIAFYKKADAAIYKSLKEREKPAPEIVALSHRVDPSREVIGLLELNEGTCKFPFGEPGKTGFGFCGKPAIRGKSWCPDCHAVVVRGVVDVKIPGRVNESL